MSGNLSLTEVYGRFFEARPATTPADLEQAYRLRFQVYCVENGFEDPARYPEGLEHDRFDKRALHTILVHRPSGLVAGTVRIILPARGPSGLDLPLEHLLGRPLGLPRSTAEISRFAISKDFRRRQVDGLYPDELAQPALPREAESRVIPSMALGLMQATFRMSDEAGITHWCALMMPALLRMLARLGIHFDDLGPPIDHRGRRQPCHRDPAAVLAQVRRERPEVWELLSDGGRLYAAQEAGGHPARAIPIAV